MSTARALVVEDDEAFRMVMAEILSGAGYDVDVAGSGDEGMRLAQEGKLRYDVVICDVRLGDGPDGMEVLASFQQHQAQTPVILMTAFGDVESAMKAIQHGAYDYISKPFDNQELLQTAARALERQRLLGENRARREDRGRIREIVGKSLAMLDVYKMVARVAPSMSTVLVIGESGTGKELVARAIHNHSPRAPGQFVAVNCTALTESLLESELFGHAKGAFTGAVSAKRGLFEEAQGGTLFLDEIGDVNPKMQAQLLRVLQEGEIRRVGGSEPIKVDVRVVAATNKDLEEEVQKGRFREDLYFRINVVSIKLPPLRERPEDIPLLVEHFMAKYARREGRPDAGVAEEAMALLKRHTWPGNVRELENVVERALALSKSGIILPSDLPPEIGGGSSAPPRAGYTGSSIIDDRPTLAELEQRYINLILAQEGGNKKRAAEILGIDRRTLYRTLERGSGGTGEKAGGQEDE